MSIECLERADFLASYDLAPLQPKSVSSSSDTKDD
jgi:hypothetical protein